MRSRSAVKLALFTLAGFTSISVVAETCQDAPLTVSQSDFLIQNSIQIATPDGEVPTIQRCDTNGDKLVDINDIRAIAARRNQPAAHPDDPMDWDRNNFIDLYDARGCQRACSEPRCAVSTEPPPEEQVDGTIEAAECFQTEDLDNDGQVDQIVAISQSTVANDDGSINLGVIFMREVEGEIQLFKDSFAGKSTDGELQLHVSKQPAGVVNLMPGTVVIDEPGTVSYKNGEPDVLYYWQDGKLHRAPYLVDD